MEVNTPYRILTPRLLLRCWSPTDAPRLAEAVRHNLDHLRPWMSWANEQNTQVDYQYPRLRKARARFDLDEEYVFGIFSRDGQQILGSTGLHTRLGPSALEIGYWIDKDHINQGLATESSAALTKVAFEIFQVERVEIHCDPLNLASAAVPRKLGYTHDATLRARILGVDGALRDSMVWSLLASEYPNSPAARLSIEVFDGAGRKIEI